MTTPKDFLAIITLAAAGGSYHNATDPAAAALKAAKQARRDWPRLYQIPKGHVWKVAVYDVTDHPNVYWDARGVFDESTHAPIPRHSIEEVTA